MHATGYILLATLTCLTLGGCASQHAKVKASRDSGGGSLVLGSAALMPGDESALLGSSRCQSWEVSRNDAAMGQRTPPAYQGLEYAEIVTRDWMRTINGRPSESSYTMNFTVRRRATN